MFDSGFNPRLLRLFLEGAGAQAPTLDTVTLPVVDPVSAPRPASSAGNPGADLSLLRRLFQAFARPSMSRFLLGMGAQMLGQGPGRMPASFGQSLGAGLQGGMKALADYEGDEIDRLYKEALIRKARGR